MKKILFAVLLITGMQVCSFAQSTNYRDDIRTLLVTMQAGRHFREAMRIFIDQFKETYPDVPQEFWDEVIKSSTDSDVIELLVPIYEKYFDETDIKTMMNFFATPTGKKYIEETPAIMRDAGEVGKAWGEQLGKDVYQKLINEGYVKDENNKSN